MTLTDMVIGLTIGARPRPFTFGTTVAYTHAEYEEAWRAHRRALLEWYLPEFVARQPGRRPWWYWTFELGEQRPRDHDRPDAEIERLLELGELSEFECDAVLRRMEAHGVHPWHRAPIDAVRRHLGIPDDEPQGVV